jgi:hypothetical protein
MNQRRFETANEDAAAPAPDGADEPSRLPTALSSVPTPESPGEPSDRSLRERQLRWMRERARFLERRSAPTDRGDPPH